MDAPAQVELAGGVLRVSWRRAELREIRGLCRLASGSVELAGGWAALPEQGPMQRFAAECGALVVGVALGGGPDGLLRLSLWAEGPPDTGILEVGLECSLQIGGRPAAWFLHSGFQSWDRAALQQLEPHSPRQDSWWTAALAAADGLAVGFSAQSCEHVVTRFEHHAYRLRILQCQPPRPFRYLLGEGAQRLQWKGEGIAAGCAGTPLAALARVVPQLGRQDQARVPQGWLSWYRYGPWVERKDIVENAAVIAEGRLAGLGYRVVQIDDGWQRAYGDWQPNPRFQPVADLIRGLSAAGQVAGVWTAPFLVGSDSELARSAPESWFVHDEEGARLVEPRPGLPGEMYVLDAAQEAARRHLRRTFEELYEVGFRYFKIDYLYPGTYSGVAAYRLALQEIRDAVRDSYVLACGAPLMPSAGLVDGCRIGEDTAHPIYNFETGLPQPTVFGDEVQWAARNLAARRPLAGWFQLDADIAIVGGNLSLMQARQLVTLAAVSGGPFFASDDLTTLPEERLALLAQPEVLALVGREAAVPDWDPQPWERPPSVWRSGNVIAVFNWEPGERQIEIRRAGRWRWRDLWEDKEPPQMFDDILRLVLPPDGVRLLVLDTA